ncbi:hypothetical protein FDZ74_17415, partial [bacterium]
MDALPEDYNFRHLSAELRQIDSLVQSRLQAALAANAGTVDPFRGLYVSQQEAQSLSNGAGPAGSDPQEAR